VYLKSAWSTPESNFTVTSNLSTPFKWRKKLSKSKTMQLVQAKVFRLTPLRSSIHSLSEMEKKKTQSFTSNRETILTELVQAIHLLDDGREPVRIRPRHLIPLICAHTRTPLNGQNPHPRPETGTNPGGQDKRERERPPTADEVLHGVVPRPQHARRCSPPAPPPSCSETSNQTLQTLGG